MVNWDGTRFGYREKTWEIRAFQGFRKITDLPVFPLDADSDRDQIKQLLVGRGRMFHRLCSQHVKVYTGVLHFKQEGRKMAHLSERIIVDAYAFYKFHTQQSTFLTEEEYIIAIPYVRRFALKSKTWYKLDISNISPVMWNEKLLVQDQGHHEDGKFDDFIEDKGKGLILLLAGPPGVGKTLTAESVVEELKRPLYRVNAGDLGRSADTVKSSLKEAFNGWSHWNAVLSIDEATVLLEKRSSDRFAQNELVSIFLTTLEYYTDTLILTANRCGDIDPVFESHSRRQIWLNFIARFHKASTDINNLDLDSLELGG
ncbi:P-loop containing nucleoside triphosphate hydrolase protein [Fusarium oxysporum]|nr:P-loop containing nucleoside triphosphate hydrolase protein [Fusarium oxysporum]